MIEAIKNNLSVNVLSLYESDNSSRVQVKVFNKDRELSKFYFIDGKGEQTIDEAIKKGIEDFLGKMEAATPTKTVEPRSEVPGEVPPPIPQEMQDKIAEEVKKSRSKKKNEGSKNLADNGAGVMLAEKVETETSAKATPLIKYDIQKQEHKSTLASYLNTNYPKWQTMYPKERIKEFSTGLNGKEFLDYQGNIVETFKAELAAFFGGVL